MSLLIMQIRPLLLATMVAQLASRVKSSRLSFTHLDCRDELAAMALSLAVEVLVQEDWSDCVRRGSGKIIDDTRLLQMSSICVGRLTWDVVFEWRVVEDIDVVTFSILPARFDVRKFGAWHWTKVDAFFQSIWPVYCIGPAFSGEIFKWLGNPHQASALPCNKIYCDQK